MRVTDSIAYRNFLTGLENLNSEMNTASQQFSTGKKLLSLKDSPSASAEVVDLRARLSELDQYQSNNDSGTFFLNVADSALNSLNNLITSIFTTGSAVASGTNTAELRGIAAVQVRSLRDQVLALANTEADGRYIFAGSKTLSTPFTISGDAVTYHGDLTVNSIEVADGVQVQQNVPGSTTFQAAFDNINALLAAMDSNDGAAIGDALSHFSSTLSGISQVRTQVGSNLSELSDLKSELDSGKTNITARRSQIEDANQAEAVTKLTQTQTAIQASLKVQSLVRQYNLFDFLA